ncbi:type I restriction endonuclease subunit R [Yersinia pseudotuberculosis]|uniref:type I restriction endonuclease subunit R n=3 Tax=Yersinia TaxID=629 RepID=UPI0005E4006A|nr:type I restriction endonuclease [Yersinia pseudotuberculosis]EKN4088435.1 type I restriction endonuclease subunit R [Yersinia enterocolitica]CNM01859.1 type I restriction enzyme restriction subunit [Yersinia intermedia]AXY34274.1 type I restriction endonuclease subunit R [Yersinia pseudotuberculosis]AYX09946.1 type I restriction endonuclease subunit R [Yersinia pseudotuberculosis]PEI11795.1 type I restriction endonuclease subunit R [Yersinia pseudotuberculosis]
MITAGKKTKFTEDTRVKIPTILHLMRLGYTYLSLKGQSWDKATNIFPEIFKASIARLNPNTNPEDIGRLLKEVILLLDNEDLGRVFFEKLTDRSNVKLIDFENFNNNSFHVVTELTCENGDEEFRPDITLLINGMPLVFIEVKKPNNREGIIAERNRINERFQNPKFRRFANVTQFMIFSNNMEYDDGDPEPIQGTFYASSSYHQPVFNYFREEEIFDLTALLKPSSEEDELIVLKDNNLEVIRNSPEFQTNKDHNRPTNRICTSLLSRNRLSFILRYALAYVAESDGWQKHIMRYPQLFATKEIERKLNAGIKKGIIWHTQGSGKTALAYYNVSFLTDYFQQKHVIPKFYFIVDRIDLLQQAQREFTARGLTVHLIDSRDAFARDIKTTQVIHNHLGKPEITVVNIQKFSENADIISTKDYDMSIQRVYFLDEVHRSYNPKGSFLANLSQSDIHAIKIGLTGTPLLGTDYNSRLLFGEYIHKYYYDASIADGYTLRLIREEIASNYRMVLQQALKDAEVQMGCGEQTQVYSHPSFVSPMLEYIVTDFENSRRTHNDDTIGGMVICASAEQAKQMFALFNADYASSAEDVSEPEEDKDYLQTAEPKALYNVPKYKKKSIKNAALILHDVGTKQERKDWVEDFKAGKIDLLFVFNMLLTGFDAKRLKKLYLGRVIRKHNLLQALTRVNRTYKDFRYGYVVDFADISQEFDATNKAYFEELQDELGDEMAHYSKLFKSHEEIRQEIEHIKDVLFQFDIENAEIFADQISQIQDRETALVLKNALADARSLYNVIRLQGDYDFLAELDFSRLNILYREASNRLDLLNLREGLEQGEDISGLLNRALEDVIFEFVKVGEEELVLADKLKQTLRRTREALASNFDQQDPRFVTLREELERLFKKKKLSDVTQNEMVANIGTLNRIHDRIKELNRLNHLLRQKYRGDVKYARTHKRLQERGSFGEPERKVFEALLGVKQDADEKVLNNSQILNNESYFEKQLVSCVLNHFEDVHHIKLTSDAASDINRLIVAEYLNEFNTGARTW